MKPHALTPAGQRSQLKIAGIVHEQERDVTKRLALLGMENQADVQKDMVMRAFSYDGASYKEQQAVHNRQKEVEKWVPYPAMTIVLYFGKTHQNAPRMLKELFGDNIPVELEPYVNDYKLQVFEISFLSPETVSMSTSDFRIVADFFVQTRENEEYEPSAETITHVEGTLKLMSVLTGNARFDESINEVMKKGGSVTMCDVLDLAENRGMQKGLAKGVEIAFHRSVVVGTVRLTQALILIFNKKI